jgi:hypothetical protein
MFGRERRISKPDTPLDVSLSIFSKILVARRVHRVLEEVFPDNLGNWRHAPQRND